jgi:hypothetical protein
MRQAEGAGDAAICDALAAIRETTAAWEPTMSRTKGPDPVCTRNTRAQREMPDHNWNPPGDLRC